MTTKLKHLATGCDPEGFAKHEEDGYIPACLFMEHMKGEGPIHADGCCVEMSIPPSKTEDEFLRVVNDWKERMEIVLEEHNLKPVYLSSVNFEKKYMRDTRTLEAGCDPDYSFYTRQRNIPVIWSDRRRVAGGHVHISWDGPKTPVVHRAVGKSFEIMHGLVGVLHDQDIVRPGLYGMAGSFRPKDYGMEIRSPSNWWLKNDDTIKFTFRCAKRAVEHAFMLEGTVADHDLISILNRRDEKAASRLINLLAMEVV
jgi:hypothetical protein